MTEHWLWPQWVEAGMLAFSMLFAACLDGDEKTGKHSFAITAVSLAIGAWVLYCGGFWS